MQFNASLSGASSGSGKEGWFFRMIRREVTASKSVSRFDSAASRVLRISAGVKMLKMSSVDSGSSQNFNEQSVKLKVSILLLKRNETNSGPERIIGRYIFIVGEAEDALFENKLGLRGSHTGSIKLLTWGIEALYNLF
jgi:hypothetical protein